MGMFDNGVNAPGGMSYAAPLLSFQGLGEIGDAYNRGNLSRQELETNKQLQQLNQQRIEQGQRQNEIAQTFKGGLPIDPATGAIDYKKAVAMLAQKGDTGALWNGADAVLTQGAASLSPLLMGGGQPAQGAPQATAAPASIPARPLPPPAQNSPQGDPGKGTIASIVTDRLPNQDATTGQTIVKVAQLMGVDPNATLTPGQLRRAQGLVQKYAPASDAAAAPAAQPVGAATFRDRFAAAGDEVKLPPSANAVSAAPAASAQPAAQPAPIGAPSAPAVPAAVPAAAPAAAAPTGHPIKPQTPLPKGFTDPQQAIMALRQEAARMSANPKAAGQVEELRNWAGRIEESIKPVTATVNTILLDPATGQPVYNGGTPSMAPDAIQAAAENYLQTGKLPPNMGRGTQGNVDRNAILNSVSELATARGIDQADLPQKWQEFAAAKVAVQRFQSGKQGDTVRSFNVLVDHLDTLQTAANALKNGDIRAFNGWKQSWAAATGGTAPTNFDGVKALVGDEIVKAIVGGAGALADREEVKKDLNRASSPKQLAELVENYKKLSLGQLNGLRKQYEVATKRKDFGDMLLPGTLKALGGHEAGEGKSTPDKDGWVTAPNGVRIREVK